MIKMILNEGAYDSAYNYYIQQIFNPFLESDPQEQDRIKTIDQLNKVGFFTRILLEEYRRLGDKLYGTSEEQSFHEESKKFLIFLSQLANRKPGDFSTLAFKGERIKIAIIFVAKYSTYKNIGIEAYTKRIETNIKEGSQRIFVLSYAQRYENCVEDSQGFVVAVERHKDFHLLNELEKACSNRDDIRLLKKQKYGTKDGAGNSRSAKYLLYEVIK